MLSSSGHRAPPWERSDGEVANCIPDLAWASTLELNAAAALFTQQADLLQEEKRAPQWTANAKPGQGNEVQRPYLGPGFRAQHRLGWVPRPDNQLNPGFQPCLAQRPSLRLRLAPWPRRRPGFLWARTSPGARAGLEADLAAQVEVGLAQQAVRGQDGGARRGGSLFPQ